MFFVVVAIPVRGGGWGVVEGVVLLDPCPVFREK
jgi:hypothetical protein